MRRILVALTILLAAAVIILSVCLGIMSSRVNELKNECVSDIFSSLNVIEERLAYIVYSEDYTCSDSEKLQSALGTIDSSVKAAKKLCGKEYYDSFFDLQRSLGSYYSAEHNGINVQSVLFDGQLSENEQEFLKALHNDMEHLLKSMSNDDGSKLSGLSFEDIESEISVFLRKWGEWSWNSEAPYDLLNAG